MDEARNSHRGQTDIAGKTNLRELALFFLRLGTTSFGGPAAHIAMMEDEVVRRRQWVTREKFLDLLVRLRLNSLWLVLGGALTGWLVYVLKTICAR